MSKNHCQPVFVAHRAFMSVLDSIEMLFFILKFVLTIYKYISDKMLSKKSGELLVQNDFLTAVGGRRIAATNFNHDMKRAFKTVTREPKQRLSATFPYKKSVSLVDQKDNIVPGNNKQPQPPLPVL